MLFNSYTFLVFALAFFGLYYVLRHRAQNRLLLVASYVFYGAWDYRFLILILGSTIVDYTVALKLQRTERESHRKRLLFLSCAFNLGALGFFKYCGFFVDSATDVLALLGLQINPWSLNIILPVGISFYTFQTMGYTIDVYRRRQVPVRSFPDFALFVAFFPQLVAGPIERASHLLPQLAKKRTVRKANWITGGWLITWGLFKKCVVADNLGIVVDQVFGAAEPASGLCCLLAIYAFAFQIYCDFSGYSDIARGLGSLMGIKISLNFNRPYLARNPREFWRRWHISLSTWLRDYVYIPLGGSRSGKGRGYRNLMITMLLGGLWHGAAWTFVLWGAFHGSVVAIHRALIPKEGSDSGRRPLLDIMAWFGMFHVVCIGWLIFRADSVEQIVVFLRQILTAMWVDANAVHLVVCLSLFVAPLWIVEMWIKNHDNPTGRPGWNSGFGAALCSGLWLAIILLSPPAGRSFIYFQF